MTAGAQDQLIKFDLLIITSYLTFFKLYDIFLNLIPYTYYTCINGLHEKR